MKDHPLVSIVTPAYNQGQYLAETIESVLSQDYPNIEYIVIDDGSTDTTPDILKRYNGRIRWERQSNAGQARTLNHGWSGAHGDYLAYLSSDDILHPTAISKLVNVLKVDETIVCAFPNCDLINGRSRVVKRSVCRPFDLAQTVIQQECYIGPGALFRASTFKIIGGWRTELKLAPDREFWIRLARYGSIHFLNEVLGGYRIHAQSISYKDVSEAVGREYLLVLDELFLSRNVPPQLLARQDEAYGFAHLLLARNAFRSGNFSRGLELYRVSCARHPPLASLRTKLVIARNVVSKPIRVAMAALQSSIRIK